MFGLNGTSIRKSEPFSDVEKIKVLVRKIDIFFQNSFLSKTQFPQKSSTYIERQACTFTRGRVQQNHIICCCYYNPRVAGCTKCGMTAKRRERKETKILKMGRSVTGAHKTKISLVSDLPNALRFISLVCVIVTILAIENFRSFFFENLQKHPLRSIGVKKSIRYLNFTSDIVHNNQKVQKTPLMQDVPIYRRRNLTHCAKYKARLVIRETQKKLFQQLSFQCNLWGLERSCYQLTSKVWQAFLLVCSQLDQH